MTIREAISEVAKYHKMLPGLTKGGAMHKAVELKIEDLTNFIRWS